jgi:hypothetical protein
MYRAPEMVDLYLRPMLTEKTDIWALGCMLYAMCFLIHPFQDGSTLGILNAKIHFPATSPYTADVHTIILRLLDVSNALYHVWADIQMVAVFLACYVSHLLSCIVHLFCLYAVCEILALTYLPLCLYPQLDPECRPGIDELLVWLTAVAKGQALPEQNLTQEALQCRASRLAADEVRQTKQNAKLAKAKAAKAAPKKPVALSSNSVAARRLATMRGLPVPEGSSGARDSPQHEEEEGHEDDHEGFDPFATHSAPAQHTEFAPRPSFTAFPAADAGSFDPFGTAPAATAAAPPRASFSAPASSQGFASFGDDADAFGAPSAGGFDAFGAESTAPAAHIDGFSEAVAFTNFDDAAATTPASSTFDAFAPTSAFENSPSSGGNCCTTRLVSSFFSRLDTHLHCFCCLLFVLVEQARHLLTLPMTVSAPQVVTGGSVPSPRIALLPPRQTTALGQLSRPRRTTWWIPRESTRPRPRSLHRGSPPPRRCLALSKMRRLLSLRRQVKPSPPPRPRCSALKIRPPRPPCCRPRRSWSPLRPRLPPPLP